MMRRRFAILLTACAALMLLVTSSAAAYSPFGLWQRDFRKVATDGYGDWQNIYAWSLASFKGDLYVGTARQAAIAPVMEFMTGAMPGMTMPPGAFPDDAVPFLRQFVAMTPTGPVVTDEALYEKWNAASHAEIWRLRNGKWTCVYRAGDVPSFLRAQDGTYPYLTSSAIGFRNMVPYKDKHGVEALYASSGSFTFAYSAPLLFRSTDGKNWTTLTTPAAMGRESRTLGVHNGKLYVGAGTATLSVLGGEVVPGSVWCSNDPADPASWQKVLDFPTLAPGNTGVTSLASANGFIYAGTENVNGFEVWRSTVANPTGNADWKQLVKDGAGDRYNGWAGTMRAFRKDVYVGSMAVPGMTGKMAMKAFDLIRVRPNDTWQLLVGNRDPEIPVDGAAPRRPLSGWPSGFGMPTNLYCWSMEVYHGKLYVGSMDMSSMLRAATEAGAELPDMGIPPTILDVILKAAGFDLWKTGEGLIWAPVTLRGLGDYRNYGARTMRVHNDRLYIGTANPFRGLQVWEGRD
jgi:hypothetical protein